MAPIQTRPSLAPVSSSDGGGGPGPVYEIPGNLTRSGLKFNASYSFGASARALGRGAAGATRRGRGRMLLSRRLGA